MPEEDVFALQAFILVKKYTYKQSHVTCSVCSIYFILCVLGVSHAKTAAVSDADGFLWIFRIFSTTPISTNICHWKDKEREGEEKSSLTVWS